MAWSSELAKAMSLRACLLIEKTFKFYCFRCLPDCGRRGRLYRRSRWTALSDTLPSSFDHLSVAVFRLQRRSM